MQKELKRDIFDMISTLKQEEKKHLAKEMENHWDKTFIEYSKFLNSYKPDAPIEDIFKKALSKELERLGYSKQKILKIIEYSKKHRVVQTGPHISPAGKPRFFFINWLASLSLNKKDYFLVAMFSGVPFSNKTRPGRLCRKEEEINMIPSSKQDALVYRSTITEKMIGTIKNLPIKLKNILPNAKEGGSYTKWALKTSKKIENKHLKGEGIFFDFNEVMSNYILLILKAKEHPLNKILFSKKERKETISLFKDMVFFYAPIQKGKNEEMENFFLKDGYLESKSRKIILEPEILKKELENRLCPGLIIGFFVIAFINKFQCFGSFAQIEYLPLYKSKFTKLSFLKKYNIKEAPAGLLTTGGFPFDPNLYILDIILGEKFIPDQNALFGESLIAIKDVLIKQNYSMNLIR